MVAPFAAAKAYAAVQAQASTLAGALASPGAADGPGFADVLKHAMTEAVQSSRSAEAQIVAHAQGKADLVDVVTAISSAQANLQTVMAVRDQVITAYQQIMQMPI